MEESLYLAKVIGLFSVISGVAVLAHYKELIRLEAEAIKNPLYVYFSGFIALILGLLMTVAHPVWTSDWRVIITILGWLLLLKGVLRIFFPGKVIRLITIKEHNKWFISGEIVFVLVGIFLLIKGFTL